MKIKNIIKTINYALSFAYLPCLLIMSLFYDYSTAFVLDIPFWLRLLVYLIYITPFFMAFITLIFNIITCLDKSIDNKKEKILSTVEIVLALAIIIFMVFHYTVPNGFLLYIADAFAVLVVIIKIVKIIICKKTEFYSVIKTIQFLITLLAIILIFSLICFIVL